MKQIILQDRKYFAGRVCAGRLAVTWGLYGYAIAWLWQLAGSNGLAQAATWAVAVGAGALLLGMGAI